MTCDGTGVVSHAGTVLLAELADRIGLTVLLSEATDGLRERRAGHDPRRVLVDAAVAIAAGAVTITLRFAVNAARICSVNTRSVTDRGDGGRRSHTLKPARDTFSSRHTGDVVVRPPLLVDEGEPRHLVDSSTKKAAASFTISRSVRSVTFSHRNRAGSARSAAVNGGSPVAPVTPYSAASALTQFPSVVSLIPRTWATRARGLSLERTSSTARSREYAGYVLGWRIRTPPSGETPKIRVSTEAGQLQSLGGRGAAHCRHA